MLLAFLFVFLRGQDINWDLQNYHYYTGYALLNGRLDVDVTPVNLQSFFNPSVNVISFFAFNYLPFPLSSWFISMWQVVSFIAIALIINKIIINDGFEDENKKIIFCLALYLALISPLFWSELGTSFFSSTLTPLVLLSIYFSLDYVLRCELGLKKIIISGMLMGTAVGLKLTNAPFAISLGLVICLFSFGSLKHKIIITFLFGVGGVVGMFFSAWWHIRLFNIWDSPLFPFYNQIFNSPYAADISGRDIRWMFYSFFDFVEYILSSFGGTSKTSEIFFSDGRILIYSAMMCILLIVLVTRRSELKGSRVHFFIISLFSIGFIIWALMLAYQRYLIPYEFMLGVSIYSILVVLFKKRPKYIIFLLLIFSFISTWTVNIPDWGHIKTSVGDKNPFKIKYEGVLLDTPAKYLLVGVPISYLVPYFNSHSYFYGISQAKEMDIVERIAIDKYKSQHAKLPTRFLVKESEISRVIELLTKNGLFDKKRSKLTCESIQSEIDHYVVCDFDINNNTEDFEHINISLNNIYNSPSNVFYIDGFSYAEPWGRWSIADKVDIRFDSCKKAKSILVKINGHAFKGSFNKPFTFIIGGIKKEFYLSEENKDIYMTVDTSALDCFDTVSILIPAKASPLQLGLSSDSRQLGIGLVSLSITSV